MDRLAFNAAAAINEGRTSRQMTTNELAKIPNRTVWSKIS